LENALAPGNADAAQTKALVDDLAKLDPKGAAGLLEKGMWDAAFACYQGARGGDRNAKLVQAVELLTDLLAKVEKPANPSDDYGLLGYLQTTLGKLDDAEKTLEKGLTVCPADAAPNLKRLLKTVQDQKAKSGAPPPKDSPGKQDPPGKGV
jgi:tetratricopeptide (TPR) repeat protein